MQHAGTRMSARRPSGRSPWRVASRRGTGWLTRRCFGGRLHWRGQVQHQPDVPVGQQPRLFDRRGIAQPGSPASARSQARTAAAARNGTAWDPDRGAGDGRTWLARGRCRPGSLHPLRAASRALGGDGRRPSAQPGAQVMAASSTSVPSASSASSTGTLGRAARARWAAGRAPVVAAPVARAAPAARRTRRGSRLRASAGNRPAAWPPSAGALGVSLISHLYRRGAAPRPGISRWCRSGKVVTAPRGPGLRWVGREAAAPRWSSPCC